MDKITVKVKSKEAVHDIQISVAGSTMEHLLAAIAKAKEETNEYMTKLVNEEKCMPTRKQEDMESSDDDPQIVTPKKVKTSTESLS